MVSEPLCCVALRVGTHHPQVSAQGRVATGMFRVSDPLWVLVGGWDSIQLPPGRYTHASSLCPCVQLPGLRNPLLRPAVQPLGGCLGVMEGLQGVMTLRFLLGRSLLSSHKACHIWVVRGHRASPSHSSEASVARNNRRP